MVDSNGVSFAMALVSNGRGFLFLPLNANSIHLGTGVIGVTEIIAHVEPSVDCTACWVRIPIQAAIGS